MNKEEKLELELKKAKVEITRLRELVRQLECKNKKLKRWDIVVM